LQRYLALSPDCADREQMEKQLRVLKQFIAGLN
jgi:hypothetical protein